MKKSDLKPGTKVIAQLSYNYDHEEDGNDIIKYTHDAYEPLTGIILDRTAAVGKVWIKWIEGGLTDEEHEESIKVLSLESDRGALEKEFKVAEKQIKEKLKEAAKIVKEANKIAQKAGAQNLADMYNAINPLVDAMDASGWRSSSWGC